MVDSETTCVCVTMYNIGLEHGMKIGDTVAIPEPWCEDVSVQTESGVSQTGPVGTVLICARPTIIFISLLNSFCNCYALLSGCQVSKFARERSASVVGERTSNAVAVDRSHSVLLKRHHRVNVSYLKKRS